MSNRTHFVDSKFYGYTLMHFRQDKINQKEECKFWPGTTKNIYPPLKNKNYWIQSY